MKKEKLTNEITLDLRESCLDRYIDVEQTHLVKGIPKILKVKKFIQGDSWAQDKYLTHVNPQDKEVLNMLCKNSIDREIEEEQVISLKPGTLQILKVKRMVLASKFAKEKLMRHRWLNLTLVDTFLEETKK
jgi:hypothetical protein